VKNRLSKLFSTFFYLGYFPFAPGTVGTIAAVPVYYYLLSGLPIAEYLAFAAAFSLFSVWVSNPAKDIFGREDPGQVVIDEVCGYFVAMALIPPTALNMAAAFLVFRALDIVKPPPARQSERLPGGWGIVADDIVSGIFTNIVLQIFVRLF